MARFLDSGIAALGGKLGPVVWQFAPAKRFEAEDFEAFLNLLPAQVEACACGVLEVRHEASPRRTTSRWHAATGWRRYSPIRYEFPSLADLSADFVYARLMGCSEAQARLCAKGGRLARARHGVVRRRRTGRPAARGEAPAPRRQREVFVFFINGAKGARRPQRRRCWTSSAGVGRAGRRPEGG